MTDDEVQDFLRGVQPTGPRPELRARIFAPRQMRIWPWAAAAAVLLAATVSLYTTANRLTVAAVDTSDPTDETVAALAEMLGDGAESRAIAELILAMEQTRASHQPAGTVPNAFSEPQ
jgi:hypothetical protein